MNDTNPARNSLDPELLRKLNLTAQVNRYFYLRKTSHQKIAKKIAAEE